MKQIEQKLFTKPSTPTTAPVKSAPVTTEVATPPSTSATEPIAVVDEIEPHSPAQEAGIVLGDEILQFGNITKSTENPLQGIATLVRNAEGKQITIHVRRTVDQQTTTKALALRPRRWAPNKGLLGFVFA